VGVSKNVTQQLLLVISLVKFDKKCHMGGGGGVKKAGKSVKKIEQISFNPKKIDKT
jgi:hypothetical protein